jgi:hypothetical protein
MALSEAELENLIIDLENQCRAVSREYSETNESELKADLTNVLASIDYQIRQLEKQRLELPKATRRHASGGS